MALDAIEIRPLNDHREFDQVVSLERLIFDHDDLNLLPPRLLAAGVRIGGQVFGAFNGKELVAFLIALPGIKRTREAYLHSIYLGVLRQYRDMGIGYALKMAQRDDAVNRGIKLIEWSFDPLKLKNAYFNINKIGAVVQRCVLNQYQTTGTTSTSVAIDRCIAEWHVTDTKQNKLTGWVASVVVPIAIMEISRKDPEQARQIQAKIIGEFQSYFGQGLAVTGFEHDKTVGRYLFSPLQTEAGKPWGIRT